MSTLSLDAQWQAIHEAILLSDGCTGHLIMESAICITAIIGIIVVITSHTRYPRVDSDENAKLALREFRFMSKANRYLWMCGFLSLFLASTVSAYRFHYECSKTGGTGRPVHIRSLPRDVHRTLTTLRTVALTSKLFSETIGLVSFALATYLAYARHLSSAIRLNRVTIVLSYVTAMYVMYLVTALQSTSITSYVVMPACGLMSLVAVAGAASSVGTSQAILPFFAALGFAASFHVRTLVGAQPRASASGVIVTVEHLQGALRLAAAALITLGFRPIEPFLHPDLLEEGARKAAEQRKRENAASDTSHAMVAEGEVRQRKNKGKKKD